MKRVKNITDEELIKAVNASYGIQSVYEKFSFSGYNARKKIKSRIEKLGVNFAIRHPEIKKTCPHCKKEFITFAGHKDEKTTCSKKCSIQYFHKGKKRTTNTKQKISGGLSKYYEKNNTRIIVKCTWCKCDVEKIPSKIKENNFCSISCSAKYNWTNPKYRNNITEINRKRCSGKMERQRLRDIGRKGGFGTKGYTFGGTFYQSKVEKLIFEWLETNNIKFTPHKSIPNSSKISDIWFEDKNLWIEIDGINREKRKKWLGKDYEYWKDKLDIYKRENLKYKIVYSLEDFQQVIKDYNIFHTPASL
jgi:hypothetical protein